jgi:hypothetical protein
MRRNGGAPRGACKNRADFTSGLNHGTLHHIAFTAPMEQHNRLLSRRSALGELNKEFARSKLPASWLGALFVSTYSFVL